jgi:hypothetical protein
MLTLGPPGLPFAREVLRRFQLPRIRAPVISVELFTPKRLQELFQLPLLLTQSRNMERKLGQRTCQKILAKEQRSHGNCSLSVSV